MKILVAHNSYQNPGGEDAVCESEIGLLRDAGHEIIEYLRHNDQIEEYSFVEKANLSWRASWSQQSNRELKDILARETPDVAHFHNTFPLISPSSYYVCRAAGVPVVQTLHNYRLICPNATLFRDGHVCEECISHSLLRSIIHGCYQGSRIKTIAVAGMLTLHGLLKTWTNQVDLFFVCTEFARQKFVEAGFDAARFFVKPNFIRSDPGVQSKGRNTALYVGRLSPEKGPQFLTTAWSTLSREIPLQIVGEGSLRTSLESDCKRLGLLNIRFSGWIDAQAIIQRLSAAKFLVVPSPSYEGFPLTIAEAFACGVPVIAANHGAMAEIVRDGVNGLHFEPSNPDDLAAKVAWAWTHPAQMEAFGLAARVDFERRYSAGAALKFLEAAYKSVLPRCDRSSALAEKRALTKDTYECNTR